MTFRTEAPVPVRETRSSNPPHLVHSAWLGDFPWLVQGTTRRGGERDYDLALFGPSGALEEARANWALLSTGVGLSRVVHARQVHGRDVHVVESDHLGGEAEPTPTLLHPADGHVTAEPGVLLTVTTADCVPVFFVDPARRAVGIVHAGWRGTVAGVVEEGLRALCTYLGARASEVHAHLGPAICGECYEVGPEVFAALDEPVPSVPQPIDLRSVIVRRLRSAGVGGRTTVSAHCTRCTGSDLYSHRGGDAGRQIAFIGIRP